LRIDLSIQRSKVRPGSEKEGSIMDFQIYSEMVQQRHQEEAERERLIRSARRQRQKGDSLFSRMVAFLFRPKPDSARVELKDKIPLDRTKREPVT
jgi:hypothetical protein